MLKQCLICAAVIASFSPSVTNAHSLKDGHSNEFVFAPPLKNQDAEFEKISKKTNIPSGVLEGIARSSSLWPVGTSIKTCFFSNDIGRKNSFVSAANEIANYGNLSFDFGTSPYNNCSDGDFYLIRVSFEDSGSWSYIGTDSVSSFVEIDKASMNVGVGANLNFAAVDKVEFRATSLHEIMHGIGILHEHQRPDAKCDSEMDWDTIYSALGNLNPPWDQQKVDHNFRSYSSITGLVMTGDTDRDSITHYDLPDWFFKNGTASTCYVATNLDLSVDDKLFIGQIYPATPLAQIEFVRSATRKAVLQVSEKYSIDDTTLKDAISSVSEIKSLSAFGSSMFFSTNPDNTVSGRDLNEFMNKQNSLKNLLRSPNSDIFKSSIGRELKNLRN